MFPTDRSPKPAGLRLARLLFPLLLALAATAVADVPASGEAHWIDVRSEAEYAEGHLSLAVNIPYTEIARRIDEVTGNKDARIYLYCRSGRRSGIALEALQQAGYTNAVNLGGLDDARQAPVWLETCEQDPAADC